jgi:probable F420-dependent oxidoreductase
MSLRIGAKVPNSGPVPMRDGIAQTAASLEDAGFDSLWVSDHVVLPRTIESHYPFAADGKATWATDSPYFEALIALAMMAAATTRATLGTAVLVLPLRNPVMLAKQAATIDLLSGGRLTLGVGAGWLREEFDALNVPFEKRGARMAEWIGLMRECWTGTPAGHATERYDLAEDTLVLPALERPVPLLIGGHSPIALKRAGRIGDGWLAQQDADALDPSEIAAARETMRTAAAEAGKDPEDLRIVLRIVGSTGRCDLVAERLPELVRAGVGEVIVDVVRDDGDPAADHDLLRHAVTASA